MRDAEWRLNFGAYALDQGSSNLSLEGQSAAEFSSNPDQTPTLIKKEDVTFILAEKKRPLVSFSLALAIMLFWLKIAGLPSSGLVLLPLSWRP